MTGGILGGGVLLGALVVLWVVVLAPGWAKDREFRAAEQNAARLQRTLRVLVETAAVPEEHIVEATARQALAHERMLKATNEHREALQKTELQQLLIEQKRELRAQRALVRQAKLASPTLKPLRLVAALCAVLGSLGSLVGLGLGIGGIGWAIFWISAVSTMVAMSTLIMLAPRRRRPETAPSVAPVVAPVKLKPAPEPVTADTSHLEFARKQARAAAESERARARSRARTGETAATTSPSTMRNQTDSILLKPADATQARAQTPEPQQTHRPEIDVAERARKLAAQERLRSMGVVGDTSDGATDLAEALRRRRGA